MRQSANFLHPHHRAQFSTRHGDVMHPAYEARTCNAYSCSAHSAHDPARGQPGARACRDAAPVARQGHVHGRPTMDQAYYDRKFHQTTRAARSDNHSNIISYHMFAPKFENREDRGPEASPLPSSLAATKRGQRAPFRGRTAPLPGGQAGLQRPFDDSDDNMQVGAFNRAIDSLHMPHDLARPLATRDAAKQLSNGHAPHVSFDPTHARGASGGTLGPLAFDDMFY